MLLLVWSFVLNHRTVHDYQQAQCWLQSCTWLSNCLWILMFSDMFSLMRRDLVNYRGTSSIVTHWGMCPLLLTLMPEWISNYSKWWDEIIYPFPNFNDYTVEVWKWISHFIPYFIMEWNYFSTLRLKLNHVSKRDLWWRIYASVK